MSRSRLLILVCLCSDQFLGEVVSLTGQLLDFFFHLGDLLHQGLGLGLRNSALLRRLDHFLLFLGCHRGSHVAILLLKLLYAGDVVRLGLLDLILELVHLFGFAGVG